MLDAVDDHPFCCYILQDDLFDSITGEAELMRKLSEDQMSLNLFGLSYAGDKLSQVFLQVSKMLDGYGTELINMVAADLGMNGSENTGREGMSADSVLRCLILKLHHNISYDKLVHFLGTHSCTILFARLPDGYVPSKGTLQRNLTAIKPQTLEAIFVAIGAKTKEAGVEDGSVVRVDSTVVETLIHHPTDNTLLSDSVRVMDRLLAKGTTMPGATFRWRLGIAKRRGNRLSRRIQHCRGEKLRTRLYHQLVGLTRDTLDQCEWALKDVPLSLESIAWVAEVEYYKPLVAKVIDQCERRVFRNEKVPASEKIVSIFEPHTDIIIKSRRGTEYGHKINLTTGRSGLLLDISIEVGNPADSERLLPMIERHISLYGKAPKQMAADGGYASRENLKQAKEMGIEDMAFHKKCGIMTEEMTRSKRVYRRLRNLRAGIEANISRLKRVYGYTRCTWRGLEHFHAYIWIGAIVYNLNVLARLALE